MADLGCCVHMGGQSCFGIQTFGSIPKHVFVLQGAGTAGSCVGGWVSCEVRAGDGRAGEFGVGTDCGAAAPYAQPRHLTGMPEVRTTIAGSPLLTEADRRSPVHCHPQGCLWAAHHQAPPRRHPPRQARWLTWRCPLWNCQPARGFHRPCRRREACPAPRVQLHSPQLPLSSPPSPCSLTHRAAAGAAARHTRRPSRARPPGSAHAAGRPCAATAPTRSASLPAQQRR
eukprot:355986-Chlamydomonas_euryale.AAC.21